MTRILDGLDDIRASVGEDLGAGAWFVMDQARINAFADTTEDWQWIHVDLERAAASELGGTLAHGYLTLSLLPRLSSDVFAFDNIGRALNYGLDKVRFPSSVRPGDRIRTRASVAAADDTSAGVLMRVRYVVEIEGQERPACVAEALMLVVGRDDAAA
jgi:acyl dehydratase